MRRAPLVIAAAGALILALRPAPFEAAEAEKVPLYTNDDLERMFGPPAPETTAPVDTSTPEDWRWVEQFLDRQYARIDADRRHDLDRRTLDIAEERPAYYGGYPGAVSLGLGYPASVWWSSVWSRYTNALHRRPPSLAPPTPPSHPRFGGGRTFRGAGHAPPARAGGHGAR